MTKGKLLNFLEREAKKYRVKALRSVARNVRMNDLNSSDLKKIRDSSLLFGRFADAVLVDFINYIAMGQGVDLGLYTKDFPIKK